MSTTQRYVGGKERLTATFRDAANALYDPGALTFKTRAPDGTITTKTYGVDAQPVRSSLGIYYADIDYTASGNWYWKYTATGAGQAAKEGVVPIPVTPF